MEGNIFGQTSCIILAAGSSTRMGKSKALLKFGKDETFIQKIIGTYVNSGIKQVIVVVNSELHNSILEHQIPLNQEVELVINPFPEKGRFYSLQTGVHKLRTGNSCFFQNIDNPFTSFQVLQSLIHSSTGSDVIIPEYQGKSGHPALFSNLVAGKIIAAKDSEVRIDQFLKTFRIKMVEIDDNNILTNINSYEEYIKAGLGM
jgi:CTP:molybdopterin cytidylyltransferase MocA